MRDETTYGILRKTNLTQVSHASHINNHSPYKQKDNTFKYFNDTTQLHNKI